MRPPYVFKRPCRNLRWDEVLEDWYCSSTHVCYRLYSDCPMVEAAVKDVLYNRVSLLDVPAVYRDEVRRRVESNSELVELFFF